MQFSENCSSVSSTTAEKVPFAAGWQGFFEPYIFLLTSPVNRFVQGVKNCRVNKDNSRFWDLCQDMTTAWQPEGFVDLNEIELRCLSLFFQFLQQQRECVRQKISCKLISAFKSMFWRKRHITYSIKKELFTSTCCINLTFADSRVCI